MSPLPRIAAILALPFLGASCDSHKGNVTDWSKARVVVEVAAQPEDERDLFNVCRDLLFEARTLQAIQEDLAPVRANAPPDLSSRLEFLKTDVQNQFAITATGPNKGAARALGRSAANHFAEAFKQDQLQQTQKLIDQIDQELEEQRKKVEESRQRMLDLKEKQGIEVPESANSAEPLPPVDRKP